MRRPSIWLRAALAVVFMMLTAFMSYVLNENALLGVLVVVVIVGLYIVGMTALDRISRAQRTRKQPVPLPQYVANEAMRRAKYSAERGRPDLRDIGILAYRDDGDPEVYRRQAVRGSARQLRPYVVLHWAGLLPGEAEVHFALEDGAGRPCFEVKLAARLARGPNFVTPATWLPIHGDGSDRVARGGRWKLTVNLDGAALAVHPFQVKAPVRSELTGAITDDGEIEPDRTPEWADEPLSLKELLAGNLAGAGKSTKE
ncbi:MAG: hypothetical protein IT323_22185 [Anaerolineae bacterium]|nr:hypothetical protein [Anaerolineae bacterium]